MSIATTQPVMQQARGASIFNWVNAATLTASDQTAGMGGISLYSQATLYFKVQTVSGTSPTLDIYLQKLLPDGATWQDIAHLPQMNSAANKVLHMVSGGNLIESQQAGSLAANTINAVPFGDVWRLSCVVGGTSPSFNLSVWGEALI